MWALGCQPIQDNIATKPFSPRHAECRAVMKAPGHADWTQRTSAVCDGLLFMRDALAVAPSLTAEGMAEAVAGFGTSWVSANTLGTEFARDRHDGAATVRDMAYRDECTCFEYIGPPTPAAD